MCFDVLSAFVSRGPSCCAIFLVYSCVIFVYLTNILSSLVKSVRINIVQTKPNQRQLKEQETKESVAWFKSPFIKYVPLHSCILSFSGLSAEG